METRFARIVSYLFHPLWIPFFNLLLLLNLDVFLQHQVPLHFKLILTGTVFLTTIVIPLALTGFLYRLKLIGSLFLATKEERVYPVLSVTVFYYVTYYLLHGTHVSAIFGYYMLGATLLAIMTLIINFYYKISLHMIALGSFTGFFLGLSLNFGINFTTEVITGIVVAGITGVARLKAASHGPSELYTGFAMGVITMTVLMLIL